METIMADTVEGWVEHARDAAQRTASSVSDAAQRTASSVSDAAQRTASSASGTARRAADRASRQGAYAADQASDFVRAEPLTALLLTGAVGFMLGMLFSRR
jgi:ElaB/YqjD/DUF883 family membrane-anchored ribosome-binding protein